MEVETLLKVGLSEAQAKTYLALLEHGELSPPKIAQITGEGRTNCYMALEKLEKLGLVKKQEGAGRVSYVSQNPTAIRQLLASEQQKFRETNSQIQVLMPGLLAKYQLSHHRPGILQLQGKEGIQAIYDDIIRTNQEILIFPSLYDREDQDISNVIDEQIARQAQAGVPARVLYDEKHGFTKESLEELEKQKVQMRYCPGAAFDAQIIVYGNNVANTSFRDGVITTIITSPEIAGSQRAIFEMLWSSSQPPAPSTIEAS